MKIDVYTKVVLTVIALCLVWLCVGRSSVTTAVSAQSASRVLIAGWVDETGVVKTLSPRSGLPTNGSGK